MRRTLIVVLLSLAAAAPLQAHQGLHEQIAAVTERIRHEPRNGALYLRRAELYREHRQWRLAARDYERARRYDPRLEPVDLGKGMMLLEAGRAAEALFPLRRYVQSAPADARGHLSLGRAYAALGRTPEAVGELGLAVQYTPDPDPDLILERAHVLAAANRRDEALRTLDEVLATRGPLIALQLAAIDLEVQSRDYDAALRRIDEAEASSPRKESWLARRGEILLRAGRPMEARAAYQAALDAIAALPPERRTTRAMRELQEKLRRALAAD
jgi:predicted Zn-dependent protease